MKGTKTITPREISQETGICVPIVYRELRNGNIPNVKCGDRYVISRDAYRRWLEGELKTSQQGGSTCQRN